MFRGCCWWSRALAHVLLPESYNGDAEAVPGRFASTAVPLVVDASRGAGAPGPYTAKIVGGATLFADVLTTHGRVGERNVWATRAALTTASIAVVAEDVGGTTGRSLWFDIGTGEVTVRPTGGEPRVI
ncbi:MAG: chemotaxis protein CheD [Gemmatimonadetes bacterium]|nr:chemotaxis protein CheD [Gemmatimonadota bacterium]